MDKRFVMLSAAVLAVVFAGGCATGRDGGKADEKKPKTVADPRIPADREPEAKAAAEKMALGMAEAIKTGDFEKFNAVQPKHGRQMPESAFAKRRGALNRMYGKLVGVEYFGCLDQGQVNDYLWKFSFESRKEGEKTASRRELIFWVRVGFAGGKPMVAGFSFDLH